MWQGGELVEVKLGHSDDVEMVVRQKADKVLEVFTKQTPPDNLQLTPSYRDQHVSNLKQLQPSTWKQK
jgi:hypothetical protein